MMSRLCRLIEAVEVGVCEDLFAGLDLCKESYQFGAVKLPLKRRWAIPQKSPCACSLECGPLLTQLIELRLGLSQGTPLPAETLAMRSKTLPLLSQGRRWGLT